MEEDVTGNRHGVLEVSLDLVENILGGAAKENCARFRVLAFGDESEVSREMLAFCTV